MKDLIKSSMRTQLIQCKKEILEKDEEITILKRNFNVSRTNELEVNYDISHF
jgi:CRISPR/Cas system endoribonuclease Cas6 (RAMP superfamily)